MRARIVVIASAAALAACDRSPEVHERNASIGQVANAARDAQSATGLSLRAGQWRLSGTMEEMNIPGLPASAQADMRRMIGEKNNFTMEYCLTPEEAKKPRGKFFGGERSDNCRYESFDMAGGRIDAVMRCQGQPSGSMTMKVSGTYAPESYSTKAAMEVEGENGRPGIEMKMRTEAHRIGECNTTQEKAS